MSKLIHAIARLGARAGGLVVLLMAFVISIDILSRKFLSVSILSGGSGELSGYSLAIISAWGASLTLLNRAHIRIDMLQSLLPRRSVVWFDLLAIAVFSLISAVLAWVGCSTFMESLNRDSHSMTPLAVPLAIPQGIWALGLVFLFATSMYLLSRSVYLLLRGKRAETAALIGTRTAQDDLDEQQLVIDEVVQEGGRNA